jgi:hypothetical protein
MSDTTIVKLRGIPYRVTQPEPGAVVFTEDSTRDDGLPPIRFMLHRKTDGLWLFQPVDGWIDVFCCHLVAAYEYCNEHFGYDGGMGYERRSG